MVDLTEPASPAEFIAAGADPTTAANLAEQHNTMAGRRSFDSMAALRESFRNAPPLPAATPAPRTDNATLADASTAHQDAQLTEGFDAMFRAPSSANDYALPPPPEGFEPSAESVAADNALRLAAYNEGLSADLVKSLGKSLAESQLRQAADTPDQQEARAVADTASLRRMWGATFEQNFATVRTFLDDLGRRSAPLKALIESAPPLDPFAIDSILQFIKHRPAGR